MKKALSSLKSKVSKAISTIKSITSNKISKIITSPSSNIQPSSSNVSSSGTSSNITTSPSSNIQPSSSNVSSSGTSSNITTSPSSNIQPSSSNVSSSGTSSNITTLQTQDKINLNEPPSIITNSFHSPTTSNFPSLQEKKSIKQSIIRNVIKILAHTPQNLIKKNEDVQETIPIYRKETAITKPLTSKDITAPLILESQSPSYITLQPEEINNIKPFKEMGQSLHTAITKGVPAVIKGLDEAGETLISKIPQPVKEKTSIVTKPIKTGLGHIKTGFYVVKGLTHAQDMPSYTDMFEIAHSQQTPLLKRIAARGIIGYEAQEINEKIKNLQPIILKYNTTVNKVNEAAAAYKNGEINEEQYNKIYKEYETIEKELKNNKDFLHIQSHGGISPPLTHIIAKSNLPEKTKFSASFFNTATKYIPPMILVNLGEMATNTASNLFEGKLGSAGLSAGQFYAFSKIANVGSGAHSGVSSAIGKIGGLGIASAIGIAEGVSTYKETNSLSTALGSATGSIAGIYGGRAIQNSFKKLGTITIERKEIPQPRRDLKTTDIISIGFDGGSIYPQQKIGQINTAGSRVITSSVWRDIIKRNVKKLGIEVSDDFLTIYKGNPYTQPDVYKSELARLKRTYNLPDWKARKILRLNAPQTIDYGIKKGVVLTDKDKSIGFIQFYREPKKINTQIQNIKTRGGKVITDDILFKRKLIETPLSFNNNIQEATSKTLKITRRGGILTKNKIFAGGKIISLTQSKDIIFAQNEKPIKIDKMHITPTNSLFFSRGIKLLKSTIQKTKPQENFNYSRGLEIKISSSNNGKTIKKEPSFKTQPPAQPLYPTIKPITEITNSKTIKPITEITNPKISKIKTSHQILTNIPVPSISKPILKPLKQPSQTSFKKPQTTNLKFSGILMMSTIVKNKSDFSAVLKTLNTTNQSNILKTFNITEQSNTLKTSSVSTSPFKTSSSELNSFQSTNDIFLTPPSFPSTQHPSQPVNSVKPILKNFWFPGEKETTKHTTPYDAFVLENATNKNKAKWKQVANNVPLITALSYSAKNVDTTPSHQFKIIKDKGKINKIIDTTWNNIKHKFRNYTFNAGIKVWLGKGEYIEKRKFRTDTLKEMQNITHKEQENIKLKKLKIFNL